MSHLTPCMVTLAVIERDARGVFVWVRGSRYRPQTGVTLLTPGDAVIPTVSALNAAYCDLQVNAVFSEMWTSTQQEKEATKRT